MRRRRRRIRIHRQEEERPIQQHAAMKSSTPATALYEHEQDTPEPFYGDLSPRQAFVLNLQQSSGNQAVMRYIQRAKADRSDAEAVSDNPAVEEEVQGPDNQTTEGPAAAAPASEIDDMMKREAVSFYNKAMTAYMAKKYQLALINFRESQSRFQHPNTTFWMAMCEMRLDEYEFAQMDLEEALADPQLDASAIKRGDTAKEVLKRLNSAKSQGIIPLPAKTDDIESPQAGKEPRALRNEAGRYYLAAESNYKSEDYEAARRAFDLSYRRLPHPITLLNLAKCLLLLREYDKAKSTLEKALKDPHLTGQLGRIAEALLEEARRFGNVSMDQVSPPPE